MRELYENSNIKPKGKRTFRRGHEKQNRKTDAVADSEMSSQLFFHDFPLRSVYDALVSDVSHIV